MRRTTFCVLLGLLVSTSVGAAGRDPIFAGIWSSKEPGGVGALFHGLTWDQLVSHWKELGARNQYLADVEVYEIAGQRRYAGVWRVGPGHGGLYMAPWNEFLKFWNDAEDTQELIDLEIVSGQNGPVFLGVWRKKAQSAKGTGALFVGLSWDQLVAKRAELGGSQYLADVETYLSDGERRFAGVWRIGKGNGALYWKSDWSEFAELKRRLNKDQQMLDFEMFQSPNGAWNFLGVWRVSQEAGPLHASASNSTFAPLNASQFLDHCEKLQKTSTLVGVTVVIPVAQPLTSLRGDTECRYGDPDCNPCATDVVNQFKWAFESGHRPWLGWHVRSWAFRGNTQYPPDDLRPENAFRPYGEGAQVGIVSKHIQGFVRTNSAKFPYAGSHSHKNTGSVFFVGRDGSDNVLQALYRSSHAHPSGVAVLGDGLFFAEGDFLRRLSVSAAGTRQKTRRFDMPKNAAGRGLQNGGGGLGLAKLYDGTTLLIVSAPGDGFRGSSREGREQNAKPRYTRFYRFFPDVFAEDAEPDLLGEWAHEGISAKPDSPKAYSENLSVVTECGTGRIYTVHTTGDWALKGDGYWRLSRIDGEPLNPRLVLIAIARQSQHNEECHLRSSATVHVNKDGKLEFLCSERAVIKWNPTGRFSFKEGIP
jgi:hypothetical protein